MGAIRLLNLDCFEFTIYNTSEFEQFLSQNDKVESQENCLKL